MTTFIRSRRAHFRLASGVVRDLFKPAKLARCQIGDPISATPSILSNMVIAGGSSIVGMPITIPQSVNETVFATINAGGKILGNNGILRLTTFWNSNANANAKTVRIRLNNIGGFDFAGAMNIGANNSSVLTTLILIPFVAAFTGLEGITYSIFTPAGNPAMSAILDQAIDPTLPFSLLITGQLANAGDTLQLRAYLAEFFRF